MPISKHSSISCKKCNEYLGILNLDVDSGERDIDWCPQIQYQLNLKMANRELKKQKLAQLSDKLMLQSTKDTNSMTNIPTFENLRKLKCPKCEKIVTIWKEIDQNSSDYEIDIDPKKLMFGIISHYKQIEKLFKINLIQKQAIEIQALMDQIERLGRDMDLWSRQFVDLKFEIQNWERETTFHNVQNMKKKIK